MTTQDHRNDSPQGENRPSRTAVNSDDFTQLSGKNTASPDTRFNDLLTGSLENAVVVPAGVSLREYLKSDLPMKLLWKNASDRAEALIFEFARSGKPEQIFRWTGWSGKIAEHGVQLPALARAFEGVKGFHMFGGTQLHSLDTGAVIPTVADVPVALKKTDADLILVGVIPKVEEEPRYVQGAGIILRVQAEKGYFTTINPDQNIGLVLQPDVNGRYEWIHEIQESHRQCSRLAEKGWASTLVVFGGSPTAPGARKLGNVEQEVRMWAEDARLNPDKNINILLVEDGGGVGQQLANDVEWLAQNPCAHVVRLSDSSIAEAISRLKFVHNKKK